MEASTDALKGAEHIQKLSKARRILTIGLIFGGVLIFASDCLFFYSDTQSLGTNRKVFTTATSSLSLIFNHLQLLSILGGIAYLDLQIKFLKAIEANS